MFQKSHFPILFNKIQSNCLKFRPFSWYLEVSIACELYRFRLRPELFLKIY